LSDVFPLSPPRLSQTRKHPLAATGCRLMSVTCAEKETVTFSDEELDAMRILFRDYGVRKPNWLKATTKMNRHRRAWMNRYFYEAGVDESWCGRITETINWSSVVHSAWHRITAWHYL
jgi:hypothetical protein